MPRYHDCVHPSDIAEKTQELRDLCALLIDEEYENQQFRPVSRAESRPILRVLKTQDPSQPLKTIHKTPHRG